MSSLPINRRAGNHNVGNHSAGDLLQFDLPSSGLDIWWVPIPDIDPDVFSEIYGLHLADEEHARLQSRRLPKGRAQFLFTRVVLRSLLSAYHPGIRPVQWNIMRTASGRPYLASEQSPLSFNLTHSDNTLVLAFSQYGDPGIDIESTSRLTEPMAVARRYFSAEEVSELEAEGPDCQELFLRLWTLKESAVKATGLGLSKGLHRFRFSQPAKPEFTHGADGQFQFWSGRWQDHVLGLALCSRQPAAECATRVIDIDPVSRLLIWPDAVQDISFDWMKSQSRNSSTNLEP